MTKILITGGAGFIGSQVADAYIKLGHEVVIVDNLSTGKIENVNSKAKFYEADITDEKAIKRIFETEKPEIVNHHAAQKDVRFSVIHPLEDARINILGSINIISNAVAIGTKKIIYANSGGAMYGNVPKDLLPIKENQEIHPTNPYGADKAIVEFYLEMYHRENGIDFVSLRYSNVYGPRQEGGEAGVIPIFIKKILKNESPIIFGDGNKTRDFVYINEVVRANVLALKNIKEKTFNIGSGKEISVLDIYNLIAEELNFNKKPIFEAEKPGEVDFVSLSNEKAKIHLGWSPEYNLAEGLKETINWVKNQDKK